jgi:AAA domain
MSKTSSSAATATNSPSSASHTGKGNGGGATQPQTKAGLGEWDAGDDVEKPEPRGWLLGNSFCRQFISTLIADGGTGKSALRYAQALSLTTGRELTGEHVFVRSRVLIVSLEDDDRELRRRILAVRLHYGISLAEVKGWLFLAAPGASAGKLKTMTAKGQLVDGQLRANLEATIRARKIDLVILDPFVKAHRVPENSNDALDDVAQMLSDLASELNIDVDLPHHVSKGAPDPGNAQRGRGASALVDAGRLCYTLTQMSSDEAQKFGVAEEERRQFIRYDKAKVNLLRAGGTIKWFKLVSIRLDNGTKLYPNGDEVQTVELWSPPQTWAGLDNDLLNRILTEIDAGIPGGGRYSGAKNAAGRGAWQVVCRVASHKTEAQAREIIKAWMASGLLVEDEYQHPIDGKRNGVWVVPAMRPGTSASS